MLSEHSRFMTSRTDLHENLRAICEYVYICVGACSCMCMDLCDDWSHTDITYEKDIRFHLLNFIFCKFAEKWKT